MDRRKFLTLLGFAGMSALNLSTSQFSLARQMKELLKSVFYFLKPSFDLPEEGDNISVETALNSRYTSDYDENPERFHWGMFDRKKKLSSEQIKNIISLAKVPRFTDKKVEIRSEGNILTFVIQNHVSGIMRDWMMVESGMQQQAIGLICAALGVGMVFRNLGKDGAHISDTEYGTIEIKLGAMKPSYSGEFWTRLAPSGAAPWLKGNLPDPDREGKEAMISTLSELKLANVGSSPGTDETIDQLLWAARGRTPHLYKSKPWGMTIPTWAGIQDISSPYLISESTLYKHVNWSEERPTHALSVVKDIKGFTYEEMLKSFRARRALIIIARNEGFARALWEVGYQLLNLLLQAKAVDISYRAFLLDDFQREAVAGTEVINPVAVFAV